LAFQEEIMQLNVERIWNGTTWTEVADDLTAKGDGVEQVLFRQRISLWWRFSSSFMQ
jgi:hypothetical protein